MNERTRVRLVALQALVLALLVTLLGRLWYLQVLNGEEFARAASENRVREVVTPAPRGGIYDAAGTALVRNRTALLVTVDRARLQRERDRGEDVLRRLGEVVGQDPERLRRVITPCGGPPEPDCWRGSPYQPVPVAEYDAEDPDGLRRVLAVEERAEDFPGVATQFAAVRDYPQGTLGAHVLGYLGPISEAETEDPRYEGVQPSALIGRSGVEAVYERDLRGVDGVQSLLVDSAGRVAGVADETAPQPGDALVLSLHAGVQRVAEQALERAILTARQRPYYRGGGNTVADSGSVVVMEARTGRLLALASYPSYDPSLFTGGISRAEYAALTAEENGQPLLFRATQSGYAPASTFKAISAVAAVEAGQTTFDSVTPCPGVFGPTGQTNFEAAALGALTLHRSIVRSCDTNFYSFAYDAWVRDGGLEPVAEPADPMIKMALGFGLGRRTGVDLPSESPGLIPTREWRQRYWESLKDDFCAGAENPAYDAERRAFNRDACRDGFRFRGGQATNFSIGQGETVVTPLQLATAYAAVANGGAVVRPTVARALLSADGRTVRELEPQRVSTVPARQETLAQLRAALTGVTTEPGGTGVRTFAGLGLTVAGKTGTAEVNRKQDTSWFASFAPAQEPQLVVVGMVSQGGTGSTTAAPMVREVYAGIYGLDGRPAVLPGGRLPSALPVVRPDGTVGPPGTQVPAPPRRAVYGRPEVRE